VSANKQVLAQFEPIILMKVVISEEAKISHKNGESTAKHGLKSVDYVTSDYWREKV